MDLALDPDTGDLDLANGDLYLVTEDAAVAQYASQKLKLFLKEWFLDESTGVPYHDRVFEKNPDPVELDTIFKEQILSIPGIVELVEFSLELDGETRTARLTFKAKTRSGEIDFSETLPGGG